MKLDAFHTLEAVLSCGSQAAAAERVNLTPSAVSMQIKQLEAFLGKPLFDRSGRELRPTPLAHDVAAAMRSGLAHLDMLRAKTSVAVSGVIRLGIIDTMQPVLLPHTFSVLQADYPGLELRLTKGRSAALSSAVKAGDLDAAVVAQPSDRQSGRLQWHPLTQRELLLVAPPGSSEKTVAALFKAYPWIRYDRATVTGSMAVRYVAKHIRHKSGTLEFDSVQAILAMVSANLGISLVQLTDPALRELYPVRVVPLGPHAPMLQFSLVTRKADEDNRGLEVLRELLAAAAQR